MARPSPGTSPQPKTGRPVSCSVTPTGRPQCRRTTSARSTTRGPSSSSVSSSTPRAASRTPSSPSRPAKDFFPLPSGGGQGGAVEQASGEVDRGLDAGHPVGGAATGPVVLANLGLAVERNANVGQPDRLAFLALRPGDSRDADRQPCVKEPPGTVRHQAGRWTANHAVPGNDVLGHAEQVHLLVRAIADHPAEEPLRRL